MDVPMIPLLAVTAGVVKDLRERRDLRGLDESSRRWAGNLMIASAGGREVLPDDAQPRERLLRLLAIHGCGEKQPAHDAEAAIMTQKQH